MEKRIKYKVTTKHTKELLKEFVKFSFRVNHPKTTLRICVIGFGLFLIGGAMERGSSGMWVCFAIGLFLCIFAFTRHHIGVMQLKENDEIYKNGWEVEVCFSENDIYIKNSGEEEGFSKSYKDVAAIYMDEKNYYIGVEGDNLYPLPRKDFVEGEQESFAAFIKQKTGRLILYSPASMKNKFKVIREKMKDKEEAHDLQIEQKRKNNKKR